MKLKRDFHPGFRACDGDFLWLTASPSTVSVVANQTTQNPGDCDESKCPSDTPCTRAFFSEKNSSCIFLHCDNNASCDRFIAELGGKVQNDGMSQKNRTDPLQSPASSPESPGSPSTAPTVSPTASPTVSPTTSPTTSPTASPTASPTPAPTVSPTPSSAPLSLPVAPPGPDGKQHPDSSNSSASGFSSSTSGSVQNKTLENGHQGKPSVEPSAPAPTAPPVPVASVGAGNISSTVRQMDQNGTEVNKTSQETTTATTTAATTTSVKPALPTNSTGATDTTFTTTTVTLTTTSTTTPTTSTTNKITSPPSTTQIRPASTPPPPPPPSRAPPFLPSVTPSTSPPGQNLSSTTPKVPDVTSDQDKAIAETAGGELTSHVVSTSSLIAVLIFGLLFFIVTVILFLRHAYESYKRRGYTQMDYLINGMYSDSGL
ncbi:hypothetical protein PHYPO_G00227990 [Pangasianodon hypophthalmus]|uniref:MANSC domain-containing protein n=1 Tax=Pangasianodon hypophthalmus TaxID=310915 RepID=A0A5N5NXP8_PANHP|nr:hypothetical protein PHYPO_G00227990 [Pangasianodon hypophthalmus]